MTATTSAQAPGSSPRATGQGHRRPGGDSDRRRNQRQHRGFLEPAERAEAGQPMNFAYRLHWTTDEAALHSPDSAWVKQTLKSTGDVKQSNLIRQPDGSVAYLIDFEGPSLKALPEDAPVRSQVSVGDNAELVENSLRYNSETQGWRLTLRLKVKDPARPPSCGRTWSRTSLRRIRPRLRSRPRWSRPTRSRPSSKRKSWPWKRKRRLRIRKSRLRTRKSMTPRRQLPMLPNHPGTGAD
ncbi:glucan biosynthesis protein [Pseudomonas sp. PCH446]